MSKENQKRDKVPRIGQFLSWAKAIVQQPIDRQHRNFPKFRQSPRAVFVGKIRRWKEAFDASKNLNTNRWCHMANTIFILMSVTEGDNSNDHAR